METKRKSRFDRTEPDTRPLSINSRDIEILKLLDPEYGYSYLPTNWIHALVDPEGDAHHIAKRLGRLSRNPHYYLLRPPQRRLSQNANYKHDVYCRDEAGDRLLIERGVIAQRSRRAKAPYAHELLNALVDASIEYGVQQDPTLRLIGWRELAVHPKVPRQVREADDPFAFQLPNAVLIPDGRPFILERAQSNGSTRYLCFPGKEIDRNTEPLRARNLRAKWQLKLEHYRHVFDNRLYRSHYGFENALVPIVTTNPVHMRNMMDMVEEIIGTCAYLLFKCVPDWAYEPHFPKPNADILTEPWPRVGHPPFYLNTFDERGPQ